jgi:type I restriction enzyme M protein
MTNSSTTIVQKLWNYCNVLRDDGMSYGDYVEQLTYLLFHLRQPWSSSS